MGWLSWICLVFLLLISQFSYTLSTTTNSSVSPPVILSNTSSSSSVPYSQQFLCRPDESSALLQFKNSFSIIITRDYYGDITSYNQTGSWEKGKDCCTWSGVTCENVTGHVIGLNLTSCRLQGNFHSNSSLFSLRHLRTLYLSHNDFGGSPISSKFGEFVSITHLDLSYSNFSGSIPSEISHLSQLVSLNVSQYGLNLRLDALTLNRMIQNLTNLRELVLSGVDMSSVVPQSSFMNLSSSLRHLDLSSCNLQGKFPESIFRLPNLHMLDLSQNENLTGSLPRSNWSSPLEYLSLSFTKTSIDWYYMTRSLKSLTTLQMRNCTFVGFNFALLGNLTEIQELDLSYNDFGGQIPWSLLNLRHLVALFLGGNNFVGQFPQVHSNDSTQISFLNNSSDNFVAPIPRLLNALFLNDNSLSGTIPSWLFTSTSLQYIILRRNELNGLIPRSIFQLVNLRYLDLSSNNLSGTVDFEKFSKLRSLISLDLSFNHLSLSLKNSSNLSWPELNVLRLASCNISEFPLFLRFSPNLDTLDLSNNRIQGNIPNWLLDVGKDTFWSLNLSHNMLTGIQHHLPWRSFYLLDLRSNYLQGRLPIPQPSTNVFFVSNNQLTGGIPSSICKLSSLEILDLSNNSLSGEIPPCMGNFSQWLSVLDMRKNKLEGVIPATFSEGNNLRNLDVNGNQLEGPLPPSLLTCTKLEVLDIGNNKLIGTFPHWLESLPELQVLILRSNKFHGPIGNPRTRNPFQKLRIMDLSHNQFSGVLPAKHFENLMAMINLQEHELKYMGEEYYQDTVVVEMKGLTIEMVKIQTFFTSLDFSSNAFSGEISDVIGKLISLKGFNFSHNELTGTIPSSIGNLINLEWLDLSWNGLVGEIPMQLVNLTFLSKLNLSENQLVGFIPQGKQFGTFGKDSYVGNGGLCGLPVSDSCPHSSSQQEEEEDDLKDGNGFDWKIVMMGYSSGVVIGISMGYVVLFNPPDWLVNVVGRKRWLKMMKITHRYAT